MKRSFIFVIAVLFLVFSASSQNFSFISNSITCSTLGSATVQVSGPGPYSYTWMPGGQTGAVINGIGPGDYTVTAFDSGSNITYTSGVTFMPLIPFSGSLTITPSVSCNGASTGAANYTNLSGGSGSQSYLWTNGVNSYTTPLVFGLTAGSWTSSVTDALTSCIINNVFQITQPPALTLNITPTNPTVCAGTIVQLTANNYGGTPGYTYSWTNGPSSNSILCNSNTPAVTIFTVTSSDANNCAANQTVSTTFLSLPVLTVANATVCQSAVATLTVSGANSYTWNTNFTGNTFTVSPLTNAQYTVVGSALGCTASIVAGVTVIANPTITATATTPVCEGGMLILNGGGGTSYSWSGPSGFSASTQSLTLNSVNSANSGVYSLTITGANSCTASSTVSVTIHSLPTPTISLSQSLICTGETTTLTVSGATTYSWSNAVTGAVDVVSPSATTSYTVWAYDVNNCTNSATATVMVDVCTGINEISEPFSFLLFPNPVQDLLTISTNKSAIKSLIQLEIINVSGQVVMKDELVPDGDMKLDLRTLEPGFYVIRISGDAMKPFVDRFVISKQIR